MSLFMSLIGMVVLLAIAVAFSNNRKAINFRTVGGAFAIQFALGAFVLYVPWGRDLLNGFSSGVSNVINYGNDGSSFLFGGLVSDKMFEVFGGGGFIFAFRVLPTLIFFSALISVLYYIGVMQWVIKILGGALQKALGTSRAESMSAAANIFVGQTEAPLVVRPFVPKMTQSELFAVMCGGLASVAGGVLAGYASMGVPLEYLVAASFMAAPGGLLFAKILHPETDQPHESIEEAMDGGDDKPVNVIDAAAGGAASGLQLALNVGAMLIAFVGLIALINGMLGGIGGWFGMPELTLELILGYAFSPLAFLIGVPWAEAVTAGSFIGQKIVVNEFVAYLNFTPYLGENAQVIAATGEVMSEKTTAIISFALCGFANLSSIAILLGGLGSLAPNRRSDIARMGVKAVLAGTLSNLMAATIAGFCLSLAAL
ncbi:MULTISPECIES: NupC/NupG family nucleoside CNT transporter [Vibrio]|jgi:CNT family concentrative nucleoside transporter|uniref:Nucleoside permease n=2 Tax=Vibrio alginolyticus TaxID=663 RepID=A0A0H0YCX7_VIBAL|nr:MULTISPECIES: NupC/NupG family nucleoside CNT transporter [Vibrio]MDW1808162.1 NupC/NupG family nucleoside CNT transporter [Vibrio sp. Vb2362]MDW1970687.1 NupC/NupG family nucleoside CNT transporter [Vibrio sp. 945]MDW2257785.1 NupC/NupG family nucleoside CNT transporter [Vibrio sp. 1409]MDW2295022.1 NupC/NupG family nucleoside CNT transporter [Vibrio sp. 1404]NAW52519.1 NupC/NupG family nucleoside CNT transporter [Vibrio sp. V41_P2S12T139]NAW93079.1 NupC/NupG family nucleoside CNT transpo